MRQKSEQYPGDRVVDWTLHKLVRGVAIHRRDQKDIDQPANSTQTKSKEPDGAGNRLSEIESVRPRKSKDPKQIPDQCAVSLICRMHLAAS